MNISKAKTPWSTKYKSNIYLLLGQMNTLIMKRIIPGI